MLEINLKGRVAVVTGAGRGIGAAVAARLAQAGADLILVDQSGAALELVAARVREYGREALVQVGDVSKPELVEAVIVGTMERFGRLDILVNNAAINIREKALDVDLDNWDRILAVNLKGYFMFARAAGREMIKAGLGSIVNISSELSFVGSTTGQVAYSASKGGINQLTRTLAAEWAGHGLRVNAVAPGLTVTPLVEERLQDERYRLMCISEVPLRRLGQPEDIANAVTFLSSDLAGFITGQVLVVDGGYTIV